MKKNTVIYKCIYWVCKRPKAFSHLEDMKKSAEGLQNAVSHPIGPGKSPDGGPRRKAPGSSAYLGFENLKISHLLLTIAQFTNYIAY